MAADLHLFELDGTQHDIEEYKRLRELDQESIFDPAKPTDFKSVSKALGKSQSNLFHAWKGDNIWLGQVSWLTAAIPDDPITPTPLREVMEMFSDFPVVDDQLIALAHKALSRVDTTACSIANPDDVTRWLGRHIGRRVAHELL